MDEIEYQLNDKVVLMCPIDVYVDVFSMTGDIIEIEKIDTEDNPIFLYSIKLDEPELLMAPELWEKEDNKFVCEVTKDFLIPLKELDPSHLKWINKGKELLVNINCYSGLLKFLNEIINSLENDQENVAIQTLSRLDLSWMENDIVNDMFDKIKILISNTNVSMKKCIRELKKLESYIKGRELMLN